MDLDGIMDRLEREWDVDGFFHRLRSGVFEVESANDILRVLREIDIPKDAFVSRRLVELLWMMPSFIEWQTERVKDNQGNMGDYERFAIEVHNILEDVLGTP